MRAYVTPSGSANTIWCLYRSAVARRCMSNCGKILGKVFRRLAEAGRKPNGGWTPAVGPCAHADLDTAEVCGGAGDRVYEREDLARVYGGRKKRRQEEEFCRRKLLGAWLHGVDRRSRRKAATRVYPQSRRGRQTVGLDSRSSLHIHLDQLWPVSFEAFPQRPGECVQ
jgi:hypothetical protein